MARSASADRRVAWLPVALVAITLVGLHWVFDVRAYDETQLPRLLAIGVLLVCAVPLVRFHPTIFPRLDTAPLRSPVVVAAACFLAACWLSLGAAVNVSAGLVDTFRTLAAFLVLCLAIVLLPLAVDWRGLVLRGFVVAALSSAAVGLTGWARGPGLGLHDRRAMEAVTGLMSNVNLYAGFLVLLLPTCLAAATVLRGAWRLAAIVACTATLVLVVALQSRAAWLALVVTAAAAVLAALAARGPLGLSTTARRGLQAALGVGLAAGVGLVLLAGSDTAAGRWLGRLAIARPHQAAGPADGGRTLIWGLTLRMIQDHPVAGVGAGNFTVRLPEYFGADGADLSALASDNWVQPHNDFLWVWAEKGLPGIVAFVAILALAARAAWDGLRGGRDATARSLALATLATLAGHAAFSCFDFPLDRVSHQVVLAIVLATAVLIGEAARPTGRAPLPVPAWLVVPLVVAAAVGVYDAAVGLRQEREVIVARRAWRDGDWPAMRAAARRAATPWRTLDPLATPVAFLEGMAERRLEHLPAAIGCFERALAANPNRLYVVNNLAAAYAEAGRFDDAIPLLLRAAGRYPDLVEPRHNLAACLVSAGRFAEALAVIEAIPEAARPEPLRALHAYAREQAAAAAAER